MILVVPEKDVLRVQQSVLMCSCVILSAFLRPLRRSCLFVASVSEIAKQSQKIYLPDDYHPSFEFCAQFRGSVELFHWRSCLNFHPHSSDSIRFILYRYFVDTVVPYITAFQPPTITTLRFRSPPPIINNLSTTTFSAVAKRLQRTRVDRYISNEQPANC